MGLELYPGNELLYPVNLGVDPIEDRRANQGKFHVSEITPIVLEKFWKDIVMTIGPGGYLDPNPRRADRGEFHVNEIAPIVLNKADATSYLARDFANFYGTYPSQFEHYSKDWASLILLQKLMVEFKAADGTPVKITLNEIVPFLKENPTAEDFAEQQAAAEFSDKLIGFNTKTLQELVTLVAAEIRAQDPLLKLPRTLEDRGAYFLPRHGMTDG